MVGRGSVTRKNNPARGDKLCVCGYAKNENERHAYTLTAGAHVNVFGLASTGSSQIFKDVEGGTCVYETMLRVTVRAWHKKMNNVVGMLV